MLHADTVDRAASCKIPRIHTIEAALLVDESILRLCLSVRYLSWKIEQLIDVSSQQHIGRQLQNLLWKWVEVCRRDMRRDILWSTKMRDRPRGILP